MPVGEERTVTPICLSDGTLLFMYYKYPLRQAFGGVLAEPIVTLHEGPEYRIRYVSYDAEGRDRLEGARPIVTRDWKRSKWLNEFLVGLDELRLMGSLGGMGGPENELYRILSDSEYRQHLACYASKFPDESGSRLIVLNWVGPLAEAPSEKVIPAGPKPRAKIAPPRAPRVSAEPGATQKAKSEPPAREQQSTVVPLAHQGSQAASAPPAVAPAGSVDTDVEPSASVEPDVASPASGQESAEPDVASRGSGQEIVEDGGTQKMSLDTTQPVPIEQLAAPQPKVEAQTGRRPKGGPPAAPEVSAVPGVREETESEFPAADRPSPVVSLAHHGSPDPPAPSVEAPREAEVPPIEQSPSIEYERPIGLQRPVEHQRSIVPSGSVRGAGASGRSATGSRIGAARAGKSSSRPSWSMIVGAVVVAVLLLLAGWWLRGTSEQPTVASSPLETAAEGAEITAAAVATPELDRPEPASQASPAQDDAVQGRLAQGDPAPDVESTKPVTSPNRQPTPPAPVAIDAPLLAQGSNVEASRPPADVQDWDDEVRDEPAVGNDAAAQESPVPEPAVAAPPPAPAIPTLKITSEQMSEAWRKYLARVIRFLEPPLEYEWIPKYTRPVYFASLVTDGEPPECRIDFKEPTTITFDLVIRGGSGTESRIENVEVIY